MYRLNSQQEQCVPVQAWWMSPSEQPCCRSVYMYSIYTTPQPLHSMLQDMCLENITCSNTRHKCNNNKTCPQTELERRTCSTFMFHNSENGGGTSSVITLCGVVWPAGAIASQGPCVYYSKHTVRLRTASSRRKSAHPSLLKVQIAQFLLNWGIFLR